MAVIVSGTFADRSDAHRAIQRLRAAGIPPQDISMIVRDMEDLADPVSTELGVRGGAVAPAANPPLAGAEPVVPGRVVDDEVEVVTPGDYTATAAGTATGALVGGISGLLIGLGTLALPGLGPVLAAGPLAAALGGAAIGAATGGLIGALVDAGVPEVYATTYATDVERGHVLLTVRTDEASRTRVREILAASGALNLYPTSIAV
jgi:hypothetical protein